MSTSARRFDLGGTEGLAVFKAMANPLRQRIIRILERDGPANSTSLARELDESTGTTSYHLRQLAACGLIEEIPERSTGRERWWRPVRHDFRTPPIDEIAPEARAFAEAWQERKIENDLRLMRKAIDDYHAGDPWVTAWRWNTYLTRDELKAFTDEYAALISRFGHTRFEAPEGAKAVCVRMFGVRDNEDGHLPTLPTIAGDDPDPADTTPLGGDQETEQRT